jgi:Endonuclease-reverse transcriptase
VLYRSPSAIYKANIDKQIVELVGELCGKSQLWMSDFNYPSINWINKDSNCNTAKIFVDCLEEAFLTQHVVEPTRDDAILDLVITSDPNIIDRVHSLGKFAKIVITMCSPDRQYSVQRQLSQIEISWIIIEQILK